MLHEYLTLLVIQKHREALNGLYHVEANVTAVLAAVIFLNNFLLW